MEAVLYNVLMLHPVDRKLEVGDQVLCRIPGMSGKLMESWHGPYPVEARKSRVDYQVKVGKGRVYCAHTHTHHNT